MMNKIETFLNDFYEKRKNEIKQDIDKIHIYYKKNKTIIFWIIICFISLEYLDYPTIINVCNDKYKYSRKQFGGQGKLHWASKRGKSSLHFLSKRTQGLTSKLSAGTTSLNFLSNFGNILTKAFYIISIILLIIGAVTLPILLIMILTYFTIKHLAGKIMDL